MDLKNQTITLGALLRDPRARAVLQRRFGQFLNHPMLGMAKGMTLAQLVALSAGRVPQAAVQETLKELEAL